MKKLTVISLLLALVLLMSACTTAAPAPQAAATTAPEAAAVSAAPAKSDQRYVMVVLISGHPFWNDIKKGAQDAADQLGVKFEFTGPVEFDAAAQAAQIEQLIVTKPAGLLVGSYDPSMTQTVNRAVEAGIPVITFDSDAPDSKRATFIGTDFHAVGWENGKAMATLLNGKGKVALLTVLSQTNLQQSVQGTKDYFAQKAPGIQIVAEEDNKGDDQITADKAKAIVQAHPDLGGIIVVNATGSGVSTAMKELGKTGQIKVVGGGDTDPVLQGVLDGAIDQILHVNTYLEGYYGVKLLYDLTNGNTKGVPGANIGLPQLPSRIDPGLVLIDKTNVQVFMTKK